MIFKKAMNILGNVINNLNISNLNYSDKLRNKGSVVLAKTDKYGMIERRVGYNELSNVAKFRAAVKGGEFVGLVTPFPYGKSFITGDVYTAIPDNGIDTNNTGVNTPTLYLLNLTDKEVKNGFIPVYNIDGSLNRDVVIARGNGNTAQIGDDFTGVCLPDAVSNGVIGKARFMRHFWDKKLQGKITHAAIMPDKGTVTNTRYTGAIGWKCASKVNVVSTYVPPATPGITEANEIMIFNTYNGVAGYKIDLDTMDSEEIKSSLTADSIGWDGSTLRHATLLFDTNKLAVIDGSTAKILQINGDGTITQLFSKSFSYGISNRKGIFLYNGYLYFSSGNTASSSSAYYMRVDISSYTSTTIANNSLDFVGGLPPTWTKNSLVVYAYHNAKYYVSDLIKNEMIVCTDLADICGTMVGTYNAPFFGFGVISTATKQDIFITNNISSFDGDDTKYRVYNDLVNNTYTDLILYNKHLVWISDSGIHDNYWTLFPLTSPMSITIAETLTGNYNLGHE